MGKWKVGLKKAKSSSRERKLVLTEIIGSLISSDGDCKKNVRFKGNVTGDNLQHNITTWLQHCFE